MIVGRASQFVEPERVYCRWCGTLIVQASDGRWQSWVQGRPCVPERTSHEPPANSGPLRRIADWWHNYRRSSPLERPNRSPDTRWSEWDRWKR